MIGVEQLHSLKPSGPRDQIIVRRLDGKVVARKTYDRRVLTLVSLASGTMTVLANADGIPSRAYATDPVPSRATLVWGGVRAALSFAPEYFAVSPNGLRFVAFDRSPNTDPIEASARLVEGRVAGARLHVRESRMPNQRDSPGFGSF